MTQAEHGLGEDLRRGRDEARAIADELRGIADDLRQLATSEVELAKAEMREQVSLATRAAIWGGVAAVFALLMLGFAFLTVRDALDLAMDTWLASLITTAIALVFAAIAGFLARKRIGQLTVVPKKTMSSVKEDVQWAKAQMKSSATLSANGKH